MLRLVGFETDFGPKILQLFRGREIFRPKSREIAPKSMPIGDAQPCREATRSQSILRSGGMLRNVRFRAICGGSRTENFAIFFAAAKFLNYFSSEIAGDRAEIPADRR